MGFNLSVCVFTKTGQQLCMHESKLSWRETEAGTSVPSSFNNIFQSFGLGKIGTNATWKIIQSGKNMCDRGTELYLSPVGIRVKQSGDSMTPGRKGRTGQEFMPSTEGDLFIGVADSLHSSFFTPLSLRPCPIK